MRPPTSESEPARRAVLIGRRGACASTASRDCGAAVAASGAGAGAAPARAGGRRSSRPGAAWVAGAVSSRGREGAGEQDRAENEPAQQHEEAERRRQDQVPALVVHHTTPVRLAYKS